MQRLKDELDQDLYDLDVQEGENLYEICAAAGGSDLELTDAELSSKDAEFGGSEAEWQQLDHDAQLELVLDAVNRRRRGLDKFLDAKAARAKGLRCALKPLTAQDVYAYLLSTPCTHSRSGQLTSLIMAAPFSHPRSRAHAAAHADCSACRSTIVAEKVSYSLSAGARMRR